MLHPLAGCSILVVAEEPFLAHCLEVLLTSAGAQVLGTDSDQEALSLIERHHPSAVVLDTGEVSKAAQQVGHRVMQLGVPCVVCSSDARRDQEVKGSLVLQKPIRGAELIEMLSRVRPATRQQLKLVQLSKGLGEAARACKGATSAP